MNAVTEVEEGDGAERKDVVGSDSDIEGVTSRRHRAEFGQARIEPFDSPSDPLERPAQGRVHIGMYEFF